jgi:hypothetical protein
MPFPCHATNIPFGKQHLKVTAGERHGMCELASAVQRRHVGKNAENGRVVAGSRQGNGMVCVNRPLGAVISNKTEFFVCVFHDTDDNVATNLPLPGHLES